LILVAEMDLGVDLGLVEIFAATNCSVNSPIFGCSVTLLLATAVDGFLLDSVLLPCVILSIWIQRSLHLGLNLLVVVGYLCGEFASGSLQARALGLHLKVEVGLHLLRCLLLSCVTRSRHVDRVSSS